MVAWYQTEKPGYGLSVTRSTHYVAPTPALCHRRNVLRAQRIDIIEVIGQAARHTTCCELRTAQRVTLYELLPFARYICASRPLDPFGAAIG